MVIDKRGPSLMIGLTVLMLAGLVAMRPLRAEEPAEEDEVGPVRVTHAASGRTILTVGAETQSRIGLALQGVKALTLEPQVTAYGRLEQDPAQSFTLRAPIAGFLRASAEHVWPDLGAILDSAAIVGQIEPRLTPLELVDLRSRWMDAQAEVDEIKAELDAAKASFEQKTRLNAENRLVSDRAVEEARARWVGGNARLQAARRKVEMLGQLLTGGPSTPSFFPLEVAAGGEIASMLARPGEAVEAGQPLLAIARFESLLVRVALPLGQSVDPPLRRSRVVVQGSNDPVLIAEPVGEASMNDPLTNGQTLLYRITASGSRRYRPGTAVIAFIPVSGTPLSGVSMPRSAVLRYGGKTWVYVKTADDQFERRDVSLHSPMTDGWFAIGGVAADEAVVVAGAQLLLSEELKAEIESEEEAAE